MYPRDYFALFPSVPEVPKVFVAISTETRFHPRLRDVIDPVVRSLNYNGTPLVPHVVAASVVNDSILTEILEGIGRSVLFLADITTIGHIGARAVRNSNVIYELGLAHAMRRPEQVIVMRSDADALDFDFAGVRATFYPVDEKPEEAKRVLHSALSGALREVNLCRAHAVEIASRSMDFDLQVLIMKAIAALEGEEGISHEPPGRPPAFTAERYRVNVRRLLDMGALEYVPLDLRAAIKAGETNLSAYIRYRATPFGRALARACAETLAQYTDAFPPLGDDEEFVASTPSEPP